MKIFELLDELREEIENSPKPVFSNKRAIDVDIFKEIVKDLNAAVPKEIREAEQVIKERDRIISDAKAEAESIVKSAEDELQSRIADHQIVQEAEAKAADLMKLAESNAKKITIGAKEYADDILAELEVYMSDYLKIIRKNRLQLSSKRKS